MKYENTLRHMYRPKISIDYLLIRRYHNKYMSDVEFDNLIKVLFYYGYVNDEYEITIDGKQYLDLFVEFLEKEEKTTQEVKSSFSMVNIEKLNVGLNTYLNLREISGVVNKITDIIGRRLHRNK